MVRQGIFYGEIKAGKLHLDDKPVYDAWLGNLEGKRVEIKIQLERENATKAMWAFLYAVVYPSIALETGYTVEEMDGVLKKRHLTKNKGLPNEYVVDKSDLSKEQLSEYIDLCIIDAAHIGVVILPPDPNWKFNGGKSDAI